MNRQEKLGAAIESAAERLPEGFMINLVIERDAATVELLNPEAFPTYFPTNHENIGEEILDAIDHAIHIASFPS